MKCYLFTIQLISSVSYAIIYIDDGSRNKNNSYEMSTCSEYNYNVSCCRSNEFQCGNGDCIILDRVCDSSASLGGQLEERMLNYMKKLDCADGSDETACFHKPCNKTESMCLNSCMDLPGNRSKCVCPSGFLLKSGFSSWSQECVDIDECNIGVHDCSQICRNVPGSYTCHCREGFNKRYDKWMGYCVPEDDKIEIIYNSNSWIYKYNIKNNFTTKLALTGKVEGLDYDPLTNIIYWMTDSHIVQSHYYPNAREGVATVNYFLNMTKNGFAIDWISKNIYWISSCFSNNDKSRMMVSKLDGSEPKELAVIPRAKNLVISIKYGLLFYTSYLDSSRINSAIIGSIQLDGMANRILLRLFNQIPVCLTLDYLTGHLYWIDSKTHAIYFLTSLTYNSKPKKLLTTTLHQAPLSLDVFGNYMYWITKASNELVRHDKFGRGNTKILIKDLVDSEVIKINHRSKLLMETRQADKRCLQNSCPHLCLHSPTGYTCAKPDSQSECHLL